MKKRVKKKQVPRVFLKQEQLFNDYAGRHGEEINRFSARPIQLEHQLGTIVDFGGAEVDLTAILSDSCQGKWLSENSLFRICPELPGRQRAYNWVYEPWHYCFFGVEEVVEWKESVFVLSEYLNGKNQSFINNDYNRL